jgi:drug/metabolite transporter (DMT)-like permease
MLELLLGAIGISFAPVIVKALPLEAGEIAFWRMFIAGLSVFLYYLLFRLKDLRKSFQGRAFWILLLSGSAFAIDMVVWNLSILSIGAGLATVLANTQVFYVTLWGRWSGLEKLNILKIGALVFGFAGVWMVATAGDSNSLDYGRGFWLGLAAGLAYTVYMIALRKGVAASQTKSSLSAVMVTSIVCSFWLIFYTCIREGTSLDSVLNYSLETWLLIICLGVVVHVGSWILISRGFQKTIPSLAGMTLLLQPVLSCFWGMIFFDEKLNQSQIVGVGMALLGMGLIHAGRLVERIRRREKRKIS